MIIGVPVKGDLNSFRLMINSLFTSTNPENFEKIVIVNSRTEDGTTEFCQYLEKTEPKVKLIQADTKTPLDAYNILFEIAERDKQDLLITQTDVIFPKCYNRDWLWEMKEILKADKMIGAVTTLNGTGRSGPDYIDGFEWLGGWCTLFSYEAISKIGGYDKEFPKSAYGVDVDHTYRLVRAGYQILKFNYWVDHTMANERSHDKHPDTEKHKKECAIYFRKKYNLGEFKNAKGNTNIGKE